MDFEPRGDVLSTATVDLSNDSGRINALDSEVPVSRKTTKSTYVHV